MEIGPLTKAKYAVTIAVRQQATCSPEEARDALEGCYCMTHYRYVQERAASVGIEASEEQIVSAIARLYRNSFKRLNYDFEHPTPAQLAHIFDFLDRDIDWAGIDQSLYTLHAQVCREILTRVAAPPT